MLYWLQIRGGIVKSIIGSIEFYENGNRPSLIKISLTPQFRGMDPVEQAKYLIAASQIASLAVGQIVDENEDAEEEILELLESVSLEAYKQFLDS
jgi:hypothetical protein